MARPTTTRPNLTINAVIGSVAATARKTDDPVERRLLISVARSLVAIRKGQKKI